MAVDGDLDTFTSGRAREDHEDEDGVDGPPPAKRRRLGNIGDSMSSVFETAVSAALIGAAVGVAAYRMFVSFALCLCAGSDTTPKVGPVAASRSHPPLPLLAQKTSRKSHLHRTIPETGVSRCLHLISRR